MSIPLTGADARAGRDNAIAIKKHTATIAKMASSVSLFLDVLVFDIQSCRDVSSVMFLTLMCQYLTVQSVADCSGAHPGEAVVELGSSADCGGAPLYPEVV